MFGIAKAPFVDRLRECCMVPSPLSAIIGSPGIHYRNLRCFRVSDAFGMIHVMIFGAKMDNSQEWDQYSSIFDFWINISTYPRQNTSQNSRDMLFLKKKAPARKPARRRPNLAEKYVFPKVDFRINDPSQIEATCLLTPPASSI